jgi:hypothetical protein
VGGNSDDQSISEASGASEPDQDPEPDHEPTPELPRRSTREPKPRKILNLDCRATKYDYVGVNHVVTQKKPTNTLEYDSDEAVILARAFAQTYSLSKGIKKFGTAGEEAVLTEMNQLHNRGCFRPKNVDEMTNEIRRQAMGSIMFLTEKRDGSIKARNVADGRKQRTWMAKDEATSPTVLLEALILTCVIAAKEGRKVVVVDIPHAFVETPHEKVRCEHPMDLMKVKRKAGGCSGDDGATALRTLRNTRRQYAGVILGDSNGPVRHDQEPTTVLQETEEGPGKYRISGESI